MGWVVYTIVGAHTRACDCSHGHGSKGTGMGFRFRCGGRPCVSHNILCLRIQKTIFRPRRVDNTTLHRAHGARRVHALARHAQLTCRIFRHGILFAARPAATPPRRGRTGATTTTTTIIILGNPIRVARVGSTARTHVVAVRPMVAALFTSSRPRTPSHNRVRARLGRSCIVVVAVVVAVAVAVAGHGLGDRSDTRRDFELVRNGVEGLETLEHRMFWRDHDP